MLWYELLVKTGDVDHHFLRLSLPPYASIIFGTINEITCWNWWHRLLLSHLTYEFLCTARPIQAQGHFLNPLTAQRIIRAHGSRNIECHIDRYSMSLEQNSRLPGYRSYTDDKLYSACCQGTRSSCPSYKTSVFYQSLPHHRVPQWPQNTYHL